MSTKNSQDLHFFGLNEECINEIYNYLSIIDWCSLRKTCKYFQAITDNFFKNFLEISYCIHNKISKEDFRLVIQNFGQYILILKIDGRSIDSNEDLSQVVLLLDRYCISLKKLNIIGIDIGEATIIKCKRLFSNLKQFVIDQYYDSNKKIRNYINNPRSLKGLNVTQLSKIDWLTAKVFNSLELLSIHGIQKFEFTFFQRFVAQNPQLKTLKITSLYCLTVSANEILQLISHYLSNLKTLSMNLWQDRGNLTYLHLPNLKKLEIDSNFDGISSFFNELAYYKQIQSLHLIEFKIIDDSVNALCNLKTLKLLKFTFTEDLKMKVCKQLASGLPALFEIHFFRCFNTKFIDIYEFVKFSTNLNIIVFIYDRADDLPCLTKNAFLSLIAARLQHSNRETLNVFLEYLAHDEVRKQFMFQNCLSLLKEYASVINLLPLV